MSVLIDPAAPDGFVVSSFAEDDWRLCRDYIRQRLGLPAWEPGDGQSRSIPPSKVAQWDMAAINHEVEDRHRTEDDLVRISRARELWDEADDPRGTLAEVYLNSRCLHPCDDLAGSVLRFHPRCPWRAESTGRTEFVPALIAVFRSIDDNAITAIHRIALTPDGAKMGRRMLGVVHRAAVKLDAVGVELAVGEGVETAMAARQLGVKPVWALGSVGAISFFPVLDGIKRLLVLGEVGLASEQAILICGQRWKNEDRRVTVIRPDIGSDLNDELMAKAGR
jgi:hypothetical protein